MKLFLTSSVDSVAHHLVQYIDLTTHKTLAFIDTAAEVETGDKQWLLDDRQALVDAGFEVFDYTITNKTADQISNDLAKADVLYFSGGNTFYLLQQSQKSSFIPVVQNMIENQGKIYIGTSAGSIIAGPKLPKYLLELGEELIDENLLDATAYNFVNFIILPHWGSVGFKKRYLQGRMEMIYDENEVPFLLLTNTQYVKVDGESLQIVDIHK